MGFDVERIYSLLPAIHRIRDEEEGKPLRALIAIIAEQAGLLEENMAQLYDDQFVETAAAWVLPYLGDLVGVTGLPGTRSGVLTPRAEVANTIAYRRRKGTASVLEQLARDLTGLPAHAVEYFQLLATTQYMNHLRPENRSFISVRNANRLEFLGSPFEHSRFEDITHTVDVRRIAKRRGRYNIPNIGIFLWRLRAYALTLSPAVPAAPGDTQRFFLSPLGCNMPLFNVPSTEDDITHLAEPENVPIKMTRRMLKARIDNFYGKGGSFFIDAPGSTILASPASQLPSDYFQICDLSDVATGWAHTPAIGKVSIDPVLGRIAFPTPQTLPVRASFHYGFSANMGGGEYMRAVASLPGATVVQAQSIAAAVSALNAALNDRLILEIPDSGRYELPSLGPLSLGSRHLVVRAAAKRRPTVVLAGDIEISGNDDGECTLDGLLIIGGSLTVRAAAQNLRKLTLRHCTFVPGIRLTTEGLPVSSDAPSLIVESAGTLVTIESCILGGLRVSQDAHVCITNSIIDSTSITGIAYAGLDPVLPDSAFGGAITLEQCTVIGKVYADVITLASNTIFLAELAGTDPTLIWKGPVQARRRQEGCIRFSYLPAGARVPQRYYCQPKLESDAARFRPQLLSYRYSTPEYCQLSPNCPDEISRGADDESEMGAFHDLYQPLREKYLRARLDEYLRFGLEAGIFYAT